MVNSFVNFNMKVLSDTGFVFFYFCLGHFTYSETTNPKLKVSQKKYWINYVQFSGNIGLTIVRSVVECMALCNHNKQCLSLFYNQELRKCVLHRKLFYSGFAAPETFQQGWKYYSTQDGTKTCCYGYIHYRNLDFCYQVRNGYASIVSAKATCKSVGSQISAINSPEKQDFLQHIMGGRPYGPVLIDGEKQQHNEWRQEDGSLLTYFNWYPNEPSVDGNCIQLCTGDKWCDVRCDLIQRVRYCCEE